MNFWHFIVVVNFFTLILGVCVEGTKYPMWAMAMHIGMMILALVWLNLMPVDRGKQ